MTPSRAETLSERLTVVRENISAACQRVGRSNTSVTLVAVSKTQPAAAVLEAVANGQVHFGENRIEEAASKIESVEKQTSAVLTWHMIGHIQSRKAREVVAAFDWIHSVDTLKLAERCSTFAIELGREVNVLLEVNVSGEASKAGFQASNWMQDSQQRESLWNDIRQIIKCPRFRMPG